MKTACLHSSVIYNKVPLLFIRYRVVQIQANKFNVIISIAVSSQAVILQSSDLLYVVAFNPRVVRYYNIVHSATLNPEIMICIARAV